VITNPTNPRGSQNRAITDMTDRLQGLDVDCKTEKENNSWS